MKSVKVFEKSGKITNKFDNVIQCSIEHLLDVNSIFKIELVDNFKKIINQDGLYCLYDTDSNSIITEVNEHGIGKIVMELDDAENELVLELIERSQNI